MNTEPVYFMSTEDDVKRHIEWLISSGYSYHLDDDPKDVDFRGLITAFELGFIRAHHKRMWEICDPWSLFKKYPDLWKAYKN